MKSEKCNKYILYPISGAFVLFYHIVLVECDAAPSIESGVYNYITNGTTSTLNYSCTEGYTMKGSQILTCKEDGLWDIVSPQCGKLIADFKQTLPLSFLQSLYHCDRLYHPVE